MEDLLSTQQQLIGAIEQLYGNFKKDGPERKTGDYIRRRLETIDKALQRKVTSINLDTELDKWEFDDILKTLQSRWSAIDALHLEIDSELEGKNQEYDMAFYHYEQLYEDMKRAINRRMRSMCHREKSTPQMELPSFSGNFQQWTSFKDLFTETIHTNASLSYAQKMQFLKDKLRGEAERLVQHLPISSDNYITCWEILNNSKSQALFYVELGLPCTHCKTTKAFVKEMQQPEDARFMKNRAYHSGMN
ncbi:unnamed protein product [Euphydryas editha]|uniref:Uncharacterized protein n=1 Tax=Euphydryas editha TaxID=104508 RepID=A0AAU9VFF4_EUPED|nr:unnamed protein product [Euphydryas editha]